VLIAFLYFDSQRLSRLKNKNKNGAKLFSLGIFHADFRLFLQKDVELD